MISTTADFFFFVLAVNYFFRKPVIRISFSMMKFMNISFCSVMKILLLYFCFLDDNISLMTSQSNEGT